MAGNLLSASLVSFTYGGAPLSITENKALVCRFFEEISRGNLDGRDELMSESYVDHNLLPGRAGQRQLIRSYLRAFPDLHFTIADLIAEGDKVVMRGRYQGMQHGEVLGFPPQVSRSLWH